MSKPAHLDIVQFLAQENSKLGMGWRKGLLNGLKRDIQEKYKVDTADKSLYKIYPNLKMYPIEVEITVSWLHFITYNNLLDDFKTALPYPQNWETKSAIRTMRALLPLIDPKKYLRDNQKINISAKRTTNNGRNPKVIFSGITLFTFEVHQDKKFGDLLKIFFRFKNRKDAQKYITSLKASIKKAKKHGIHESYVTAKIVPRRHTYSNQMYWNRRALVYYPVTNIYRRRWNSLLKKGMPLIFTPLSFMNEILEEQNNDQPKESRKVKNKSSHKKLSLSRIKTQAKKYSKSRSSKRWQNLTKKFGVKQAQRIVKESKKLK